MCHDESPVSTEKRFRDNVFLATMENELVDKLDSDSSAFVGCHQCSDASDDQLFAAAA